MRARRKDEQRGVVRETARVRVAESWRKEEGSDRFLERGWKSRKNGQTGRQRTDERSQEGWPGAV